MPVKTKVAFFTFNVGDLSGGGGYERFFSDFFTDYCNDNSSKYDLYFIVDDLSVFNKAGKLTNSSDKILYFKDYRFKLYYDLTDRISFLKCFFVKFREFYTVVAFYRFLRKNQIKILHLPNYLTQYFFILSFLQKMKLFSPIKLAVTVVDCRLPFKFNSSDPYYVNSGATSHTFGQLFQKIKLDGILTWYQSFKEFVSANNLVETNKVYPVKSRYVNVSEKPEFNTKQNVILMACRFDDQKRPLHFIEAIKILKENHPETIRNWKFKLYGKGVLESRIKEFIDEKDLDDVVQMDFSLDMKSVLAKTKCLVSTQEFENFPSLSIYEAMALGNAIIAYNVGQTASFIKHNYNGLLVMKESVAALSEALYTYISSPESHEKYYMNNINMIANDHNYENFKVQIEEFWDRL